VGDCGAGGYAVFPHRLMRKGEIFAYTLWNRRGSTTFEAVREP
jgi:hypothetical protein